MKAIGVDLVVADLLREADAMDQAAAARGTRDLAIRVFDAQRATPIEDVERRVALDNAFRELVRVGDPLTPDQVEKIEALLAGGPRA